MTDGPRFPSLGWMEASISLSPCLQRTLTRPSLWYKEKQDSSLKNQCLHCLRSHILCLLPHSRRRRLCSKVSLGHLAGHWDQYPAAQSRLRIVRTDIRVPSRQIICIRRQGAEMKRFILTIQSSWRSFRCVEIFIDPPLFVWCGWPVSRLRRMILLMHPWDTPSILATSCWELPCANTLTIRCSICCGKFCGMIPFKIQIKINSLYRNPTLHKSIKVVMARQSSFLLSVSGPQTTLTVFGHSIWLRNRSKKSTIFRSAIEHTTRNNKHWSNSRKWHLVVVIP